MLGNQYFMARNFTDAMAEFEDVLIKYPKNLSVRKKLVICYTQAGKVDKALFTFYELIKENIEFVANTHPEKDDCPCEELIKLIEKETDNNLLSGDFHIILGMLWFYCDTGKSLYYFEKSLEYRQNNSVIIQIMQLISDYRKNIIQSF